MSKIITNFLPKLALERRFWQRYQNGIWNPIILEKKKRNEEKK